MSRIVVLGSGIVGRAAAWDLQRRGHEIEVADADHEVAAALGTQLGVRYRQVDAADPFHLTALLAGAAAVVSAVPYSLGEKVAAAAVAAGCHCLDFGGNPGIVAAQRRLDDRARGAGVAVVPDCGLAPGLADVLAVAEVEALGPGSVDRVGIRVGALPALPRNALGYQLAFNAAGLINEYAEPCQVLRHGRLVEVEPLTGIEETDWPGVGRLEAFHTAGGSSSLAAMYDGRVADLDYKTLRFPDHAVVFRALRELGMFSDEPLAPGGRSRRSLLTDSLVRFLPRGEADLVLVRTWAAARRRGEHRVVGHQMLDRHDGRFSALARTTAFPATALAHLLVEKQISLVGVRTMDQAIAAELLLPELEPLGIAVCPWVPTTEG